MLRLITNGWLIVVIAAASACSSHLAGQPSGGGGRPLTGAGGAAGAGGNGSAATAGGAGTIAGNSDSGAGGAPMAGSVGQASGGAGGTGAPDAGSDAPGSICPINSSQAPSLVDGHDQIAYDGPAVVERSTEEELLLYYLATFPIGMPPDAGTTMVDSHTRITGITPMPLFPRGAKVWLTKGTGTWTHQFENDLGTWSFAVKAGQAGPLIFGGATGGYGPLSLPVSVEQPTATCTASGAGSCAPQGTTTYASAVVNGDVPMVVQTDQLATISLGGLPYDVRLDARTGTNGSVARCTDWSVPQYVSIDVRAQDLAGLIAGLSVGAPPACGEGNDPDHRVQFEGSSWLEGTVSYFGPDAQSANTEDFTGPPLPDGGTPGWLSIVNLYGRTDLPTYSAGQQYWLSYQVQAVDGGSGQENLSALSESEGGLVLLAQYANQSSNQPPGPIGLLTDLLGVSVTVERSCDYEEGINGSEVVPTPLLDVVFGTTPPVRVQSDTIGTFTLGGSTYHAWVEGVDVLSVTIYRAH